MMELTPRASVLQAPDNERGVSGLIDKLFFDRLAEWKGRR